MLFPGDESPYENQRPDCNHPLSLHFGIAAMIIIRKLSITGRVQGVGFRYAMARKARELGVSGQVRNVADGSVHALIWGTAVSVDALAEWAHRGPQNAAVTSVQIEDCPDHAIGESDAGFNILPDLDR